MDLSVKLPTIEGLLGDKLTAFAPNTIGVPFVTSNGNSMTMQVIKQLYDIGELFNIATNFEKITTAYEAVYAKETEYRGNTFSEKQVLQDTISICLALMQIRLKKFKATRETDYLEDGIRKIGSHLLNAKFRINDEAKIAASKVFCVANKILNNAVLDFKTDRYDDSKIAKIKNIILPSPYGRFNRLKPILPEAFYYVWQGIKG